MNWLFEEDELNPVELEKRLGFKRGDIKSLTVYSSGAVEIDIDDTVATEVNKKKILEILKLHNLPSGKKLREGKDYGSGS